MKRIIIILILITVPGFAFNDKGKYDLIITNVNLIDGTGNHMIPGAAVFVRDGKIVGIEQHIADLPEADTIINGSGKYLIPGIIDAHQHLLYGRDEFNKCKNQLRQLINYGVTTILIPGGSKAPYSFLDTLKLLQKEDKIVSPHIKYTSVMCTMEGAHPMKTYNAGHYKDSLTIYIVKNIEQIKSIVKEAAENNAIGIKIIVENGPAPPFVERMPAEYVDAFTSEAAKYNIKVFAHISDMEEVKICVNNGVGALMHFAGDLNLEADSAVITKIISQNVFWVTTLMLGKSLFYPLHKEWQDWDKLEKIFGSYEIDPLRDPDGKLKRKAVNALSGYLGTDSIPPMEVMLAPMLKAINKLDSMGVNMVMGTDVGGRNYILPGLSAHEEMQLLQLGGMDPLDIIKISTHNAAKMLGLLNEYGTIEKGKHADLVLLKENPLENISNTLTIEQVIRDGKVQKR